MRSLKKLFVISILFCLTMPSCLILIPEEKNASAAEAETASTYGTTAILAKDATDETSPEEIGSTTDIVENDGSANYLDIDNDGIKEKIEYIADQNILRITKDNQVIVESNLYDYGVTFNNSGMHSAEYYYDFASDSVGKVYLHIYVSSLITDNLDGKRYTAANECYYELNYNQWDLVDSVNYTWVWDYTSNPSVKTDIKINGQEADSLESIESKYTVIAYSHYEIPY